MNPEIKAKWVEALRSGEYRQGACMLYNREDDSYCCLGVLYCVVGKEPPQYCYPHSDLYDETGLNEDTARSILANMNDGTSDWKNDRQSFSQIADWIEVNV